MWLPPFELHRPKTLREAARIAADLGPEFDFLAGGTDLLQNYKCRINVKPHVVSLRHIPALGRKSPGQIGSGALLGDLAVDRKLRKTYPALARTCSIVASPLIINSATIGGNLLQDTRCYHFNQSYWWRMAHGSCLKAEASICRVVPTPGNICYATYCGDLAPLLLCLDASVLLFSKEGEREVRLVEFFQMDGIQRFVKRKEEILASVGIPEASRQLRSGYRKLRVREAIDYPELGVAAALRLDGDRVESLRVAATAIAPVPLLYDEITSKYVGDRFGEEFVRDLSSKLSAQASPYRNTYLVPQYRKKMLGVLARRVLRELGLHEAATVS